MGILLHYETNNCFRNLFKVAVEYLLLSLKLDEECLKVVALIAYYTTGLSFTAVLSCAHLNVRAKLLMRRPGAQITPCYSAKLFVRQQNSSLLQSKVR